MAVAAATALACAALSTTASAQLETLDDPALSFGTDTPYTPKAKEPPAGLWHHLSGPRFKEGSPPSRERMVAGSESTAALSFGADLFAVGFRDSEYGFAAGAACEDADDDGKPDEAATDGCTRVPVIYSHEPLGGWRQELLDKDLGFVASIAWIDSERALAVGGDGTFPRRERSDTGHCPDPSNPPADDAGMARVWLYESGSWRELAEDEKPAGMTALMGVSFYRPDPANPIEFGAAGGLCQIWHWWDGGFQKNAAGAFNPPATTSYRVRKLRFSEPAETFPETLRQPRAYAVTSGCCRPDDPENGAPVVLGYTGTPPGGGWSATPRASRSRSLEPDSYVAVTARYWRKASFYSTTTEFEGPGAIATQLGPNVQNAREPASEVGSQPAQRVTRGGLASIRLLDGDGDTGGGDPSATVSPGTDDQNTSAFSQRVVPMPDTPLASLQSDFSKSPPGAGSPFLYGVNAKLGGERVIAHPDGVPDWSVGVLRSSGQGIAYGTDPAQLPGPEPAVAELPYREPCSGGFGADTTSFPNDCQTQKTILHKDAIVEDYDPAKAVGLNSTQRALESHKLLALPTYTLNSIDVVDQDFVGYAVGDHGTIAKLTADSGAAGRAQEPKPPTLGRPRPAEVPQRTDWTGHLPEATGKPGQVPPAHTAGRTQLDHPELSLEGSPGPLAKADEIIMRPDGGEGWALGYGAAGSPQLSHYDGARWSHCGDAGQVEFDSACASVVELAEENVGGLRGADRVPLEADSDPTNDDELEIVAVATGHILRYRAGRWMLEDDAALEPIGGQQALGPNGQEGPLLDVAFTAPDDGLILSGKWDDEKIPNSQHTNGKGVRQVFYRYDGERWRFCNRAVTPDQSEVLVSDCDPHDRLPRGNNGGYSITADGGDFCKATAHANNGCIRSLFSAGERIYAVGTRRVTVPCVAYSCGVSVEVTRDVPVLLYRERGGVWSPAPTPGEIDPGVPGASNALRSLEGEISFGGQPAIARRPDGRYEGWAIAGSAVRIDGLTVGLNLLGSPTLLRLPPGGEWTPFKDPGAHHFHSTGAPSSIAIRPGTGKASPALLAEDYGASASGGRLYELDTERIRWRLVQTPFQPPEGWPTIGQTNHPGVRWALGLADDRRGGFWAPTDSGLFYRYTDRPQQPLLVETPQPSLTGARINALAGAPDGTLWATTPSNQLYRYDRALGWDRIRIPGWDPDRGKVTLSAAARDVAIGSDGSGLVVGTDGRVARIDASGSVMLDPASGVVCDRKLPTPPCGTTRTLLVAAVAPDGSALAAGTNRSLLWRPAGGELRTINPPPITDSEHFVDAAMPEPGVVWVISSPSVGLFQGARLWRGESGESGSWTWERQETPDGKTPTKIVLEAGETGYLITDERNLYERSPEGAWQRVSLPSVSAPAGLGGARLTSIAFPEGGGEGVLIGGGCGLVLTRWAGRFEVARHPDPACGGADLTALSTEFSDLVLLPGHSDGEAEAWALMPARGGAHNQGTDQLFHFGSPRADGLLNPAERVAAMPDAPAPRAGEVSVAAFGKSDCQKGFDYPCKPMVGMVEYTQVLTRRMVDEISARSRRPGGPSLALFSGDAVDSGGHAGADPLEEATGPGTTGLLDFAIRFSQGASTGGALPVAAIPPSPSFYGPWRLRRWGEFVIDRLADRGVPVLGAIGAQDVSDPDQCTSDQCLPLRRVATPPGENLAWRRAMALRSAPWGSAPAPASPNVKLRKLRDRGLEVRYEDQEVESAAEGVPSRTAGIGGADTNYAVDAFDPSGERKLARIVVVDNSQGSLAASDPLQQPLRPDGQALWLDSVLCFAGEISTGGRCTRERGQKAIVVANSPTYSYSVGVGSHTAADAAAFETVMMKNRVNLAVAGRIGWNGLYWATAPGIHEPCPGSQYTTKPPSEDAGAANVCGHTVATGQSAEQSLSLATALAGQGGDTPLGAVLDQVSGLTRTLPFVVASGAGGRFFGGTVANQGDVRDGFWHGYTIARIDPSGDPRKLIVEQRPVYDWLGIEAQARSLGPGQKMTLRGFARGPLGFYMADYGRAYAMVRFDAIATADVTHRYALVEADPERPWLAKRGEDGGYAPLDPSIATVNPISGVIKVGKGNNPKTLAVGMLSVGCVAETDNGTCDPSQLGVHVATYPLAFESRRTFKPVVVTPPRVQQRAASAGAALPPPPQAPPAGTAVQPLNLPPPPNAPALPPIDVPQVNPPSPPVPPPPPIQQHPVPLDLSASAPSLTIAPQTTVIPPPAPPIQPAPPGGARREARQRQSATQSSGSGADASKETGVDTAQGPPSPTGSAMTRRDRVRADGGSVTLRERSGDRPGPSFTTPDDGFVSPRHDFTAVARADQPSAWSRTALYGGGATLMALVAALGFSHLRPGPRRRSPVEPAAARAWSRRRW